jgi:hypothetical protein
MMSLAKQSNRVGGRRLRSSFGTGRRAANLAVLIIVAVITVEACQNGNSEAERASSGRAPARADIRSDSTGAVAALSSGSTEPTQASWSFDSTAAGQPPAGFSFARGGSGSSGRWVVRAAADAPSAPNILAQEDSNRTSDRFLIAVADSPSFGNVRVSVRCKLVGGRVDQACGIVWRYRDQSNYYVARANALENNVRFYYVEKGRRRQLEGWNGQVLSGRWHELRADMRGDHVEVYFNGTKVIDARDSRFPTAGKVGVWTKADSRTLFDDLVASPLGV